MSTPLPDKAAPIARILVRGVNWLGDAVMTTPALLQLRDAYPNAHIGLLTLEKLAPMWERHPAIDECLPLKSGEGVVPVARRIRAGRWQAALVLPNSPRSALECWLGGVPRRVGYAAAWRRWMLTAAVSPLPAFVPMRKRSVAEVKQLIHATGPAGVIPPAIPAGAHHIHHYLHLAAALGADPRPRPTCVVVGADEVTAARHRFALNAGVIWVGVNAGAEYGLAKRWPAERFAAVARSVIQSSSRGVVLTGGAADLDLATSIRAELLQAGASPERVVLLAGKTSLRELAAVLAACAGVVTNDTGPMHLAAAVGTPVVAIFGSTEPALTAPGLPGDSRHRLLRSPVSCAPCFLRVCPVDFRCMRGVTTERVVSAVDDLLEPRSSTV